MVQSQVYISISLYKKKKKNIYKYILYMDMHANNIINQVLYSLACSLMHYYV